MTTGLRADARVQRGSLALDVSMTAAPGETVVVVGPNGAGKTTFLHTIAGLLPLDDGEITVDGDVLDAPSRGAFVPPECRPVAVVFQDGLLFPHMSVLDNVAFGLRARGTAKRAANARAHELLERMALAAYAPARPPALSGGQAQRVAIARALALSPRVLLLDEPLAALDAETRVDVRRVVRDEIGTYDGVRVLVTHDPLEALTLGDRLVVVEDGRVSQTGTADELRSHPASSYVAQLLGTNLVRGELDGNGYLHLGNGFILSVAADTYVAGPSVGVIDPNAITLSSEAPHASARNTWQTMVADLDREPHRVRVRFDAPVALVADVTPSAANELELAPGRVVWCAVKATAIAVRPV
jgi:molybdate transport system ATP-binding protein